MTKLPKIVNVASVPQRSPFRYPGGKTWLVPYVRAWLASKTKFDFFIESFAGGGIVGLTVGFEELATSVVMVELDEDVAAVWHTIFGDDAKWLAERITSFDLTIENINAELEKRTPIRQKAFNTILRNRTCHGGIMAPGVGLIKYGEKGKGIKSRWYAGTLANRILDIADIRSRFKFHETDGIEFSAEHAADKKAAFFIDPPYTAGGKGKRAGRRLYKHNELDHDRLFEVAKTIAGDFLMTYDNDAEVILMAKKAGFDTALVPMKNTHHTEMVELLIGKDLTWAREAMKEKQKPNQALLF